VSTFAVVVNSSKLALNQFPQTLLIVEAELGAPTLTLTILDLAAQLADQFLLIFWKAA
jgi:hypothetical protein